MTNIRTVVVGIDGGHFELIEPWLQRGALPNIAQVIETGITADMQSVLPPVTSPNWKAYTTGKNPGKLGIYWWRNVDTVHRRIHYPSHRKNLHTEFFEILASSDSPVGVLGVPTTYPPKPLEGFVVSGAPDAEEEGFVYPSELEPKLQDEFDYYVGLKGSLAHDIDAAADEIADLVEMRFTAAEQLCKEYDPSFLQITTFYINSLHHYLWEDERTRRAWEVIDDHVGSFLNEGHNVVLMSDHGSNRIETVFHINSWLEREGYLNLKDQKVEDTLHRFGLTRDRLARLVDRIGLRKTAKRLLPLSVRRRIPERGGRVSREREDWLDWNQTKVVATGQGPVYITLDRDEAEYQVLREKVIERLSSLRDPSGRPIADAVHRGEEIYEGDYVDEAPDIVIDQAPNVHIEGTAGRNAVFTEPEDDGWIGENKRDALFAAAGPAFSTGEVDDLSILDLAPTFLHLHGEAVPADMDGRVRSDVFAVNSDPDCREVVRRQVPSTEAEQRRIREVARRLDL